MYVICTVASIGSAYGGTPRMMVRSFGPYETQKDAEAATRELVKDDSTSLCVVKIESPTAL